MKNFITTFVFLLLAVGMSGQDYDVRWYDNIGSNNVTIVADYSGFDSPMRRRVFKNNGPYYQPNWQPVQEDMLSGAGVDTLSFSFGGSFMVKILDQNYSEVLTRLVTPIQNPIPVIPEPTIIVEDLIYGNPPYIGFRSHVNSGYGLGRPSYYRTKLYCTLTRTYPDDYESTVEWVMPIGVVPQAWFNMPFMWFGDYCFRWWITDEDTSVDSHFGETEVWSSDDYCFSYGSTGFTSDHMKVEFQAFPNPFVDVVTISSPSTTTYTLTSLNGQVVDQGNLMLGNNRMDFGGLTPGFYILNTPFGQAKVVKQ